MSHSGHRFVPILFLVATISGIAVAIDRFASPPDGLRIIRSGAEFGSPAIDTAGSDYPRSAIDSDGFHVRVLKPVRRIVSQYWSLDEYVYSVVPPQNVVGVSETAY